MRILHVIETLDFGGAEKVVVTLANRMAAEHEVTICCVKHKGELAPDLHSRVTLHCLNKGNGNDYLLPLRLARFIRQGQYDVLHTHSWSVFLEGGMAGLLARVPVSVHTVHGPYAEYAPDWLSQAKRLLRHFLERLLALAFRKLVTVSNAAQDYIVRVIGISLKRQMTIHNGIADTEPLPRRDRGREGIEFITVGRLAVIKNHPVLLRAFKQVVKTIPTARLTIVGDGPERAAITALIRKLGLADSVTLSGFRTDVDQVLAQADIFILASNYEGISIALLEAMRAGLPAIGTRVGGIPETIQEGETGLLVPVADADALARAMIRLATDADLRLTMGRRGQDFRLREFSIEGMTQRYLDIYRRT